MITLDLAGKLKLPELAPGGPAAATAGRSVATAAAPRSLHELFLQVDYGKRGCGLYRNVAVALDRVPLVLVLVVEDLDLPVLHVIHIGPGPVETHS